MYTHTTHIVTIYNIDKQAEGDRVAPPFMTRRYPVSTDLTLPLDQTKVDKIIDHNSLIYNRSLIAAGFDRHFEVYMGS